MSSFERQITRSGKKRAAYSVDIFDKGSIEGLIGALEEYKAFVRSQTETFLSRLADIGISTAEHVAGEYAGMIEFSKEFESKDGQVVCVLIARDKQKIVSKWRYKGDWRSVELSPILISEFGSGWFADVKYPQLDGVVGQGTFKDGDYVQKHAFDEHGWTWVDETGSHHSYGEYPSYPMFHASLEIMSKVEQVAKSVFW